MSERADEHPKEPNWKRVYSGIIILLMAYILLMLLFTEVLK